MLANHTSEESDVPALRISLRTELGGEVYSWVVQPATNRIAAHGSLGFRSALTNPVPGASQIAVTLLEAQPITVGMR